MKNFEIYSVLSSVQLFKGADLSLVNSFFEENEAFVSSFSSGEEILSPTDKEKRLGVILSGSACVFSSSENGGALLREMGSGDTFGVANLFCDHEEFVSLILAKKACHILFFTHNAVEKLLQSDATFRMNYIRFLSERICFLNDKITCFTAGTPERKLISFLLSHALEKSERYSLTINANALSNMLNIGRASLYRAFEKLETEGLITKDGKQITVPDKNTLKRYLTTL